MLSNIVQKSIAVGQNAWESRYGWGRKERSVNICGKIVAIVGLGTVSKTWQNLLVSSGLYQIKLLWKDHNRISGSKLASSNAGEHFKMDRLSSDVLKLIACENTCSICLENFGAFHIEFKGYFVSFFFFSPPPPFFFFSGGINSIH